MNTINKFDNFIGLLNFFQVPRCKKLSCSQCSFIAELQQLWVKKYNQEDAIFAL